MPNNQSDTKKQDDKKQGDKSGSSSKGSSTAKPASEHSTGSSQKKK